MIVGTGIDIIEVDRIKIACKNPRFLHKIFTESERCMFEEKRNNPQAVAGNFAAKEAVSKALGTGFSKVAWKEIEILRDDSGKPYVVLYGTALDIFVNLRASKIWITISHIANIAIAHAIMEG